MFVPTVLLLSISLLVCEFNPHGQTWYQKFIGTYPPLLTRASLARFSFSAQGSASLPYMEVISHWLSPLDVTQRVSIMMALRKVPYLIRLWKDYELLHVSIAASGSFSPKVIKDFKRN